VRPSHVQTLLNDKVTTATRSRATVLLEEIDGDDVVVRVLATPERAQDGAKLADEIIATLADVTGDHGVAKEAAGAGERELAKRRSGARDHALAKE